MQKVVMVLVVVLGVLAALLLGGAGMMGYSFGMDSGMMRGIGATFSPVFLYVVIGLGCLLVFWLARPRTRTHVAAVASSSTSALEVSKMRYAKGEITKEQYDVIKHDLGK
jgi:uncharacterized membrane protein